MSNITTVSVAPGAIVKACDAEGFTPADLEAVREVVGANTIHIVADNDQAPVYFLDSVDADWLIIEAHADYHFVWSWYNADGIAWSVGVAGTAVQAAERALDNVVLVDAPDVSKCCKAAISVDQDAVLYCKKCYAPVAI